MPFTPFHFGPGALIHALAPRRVSFLGFAAANVLIDVEPLYFMLAGEAHVHRFFHTYLGALLVALATWGLFLSARALAGTLRLPNGLGWQFLSSGAVLLGALLGTASHIVLDSVMHSDMLPLAPWNEGNALFAWMSIDALHELCLGAAGLGLLLVFWRRAGRRQAAGAPPAVGVSEEGDAPANACPPPGAGREGERERT
ncbi:hypothetical protein BURK2_04387 [Burkholderiales bacterium]|nr:hypothetical protein BURK2_04387 [Burkholderiales bacterium]